MPYPFTNHQQRRVKDENVFVGIVTCCSVPDCICDELIQMSNGMTCWRNDVGHVYGCSGGVSTGDSGFNDVRTGKRYEYINENQAIDTRTGQPINTRLRERDDNNDNDK